MTFPFIVASIIIDTLTLMTLAISIFNKLYQPKFSFTQKDAFLLLQF